MFTDYYGLAFNPFDKQCVKEKDCFQSRDFKDQNLNRMEYLCLSTVGIRKFYHMLCAVLGIEPCGSKPVMFRAVQEQVYYLYHEKHRPLCLAVDECQYLSLSILNDLKLIMNHGYDSLNCFTLILCGESYFNRILSKPVHEALRQRIVVHYDFQGLDDGESAGYIRHKIQCAGGSVSILEEAALSAVQGYAQGNPRVIDNLMTDVLMIGAQTSKTVIDAETVLAAVNNQQL